MNDADYAFLESLGSLYPEELTQGEIRRINARLILAEMMYGFSREWEWNPNPTLDLGISHETWVRNDVRIFEEERLPLTRPS